MAIVNITVFNDADFYRGFIYKTQDGAPVNLTGSAFVMKLRRRAEDATVFLSLSTDPGEGITIISAAGGEFSILVTQLQLLELGLGTFEQSLVMDQNGLKQDIWHGDFIVNAGPSR
jgi:hypothetical protein